MAPVGIARHRVDAAVGGAGAHREDRRGLGRQPVEPFVGRHRLTGRRVVAEAAPVALGLDRLVRDGPLHHQHERVELAPVGLVPPLDEGVGALLGAALEVDQRPVHRDLGQARQGAERDLLDAGLGGGGQRHRVPVAAEASVHPENMQDRILRGLGHSGHPFARRPVSAGALVRSGASRARRRPDRPATRTGFAPVHGAVLAAGPIRRYGWTAGIGMRGVAGPRETVLGVPQ